MEISRTIKNNNKWEYEAYKNSRTVLTYEDYKYTLENKLTSVLTYADYKDALENELTCLTKNTSDKIILLKNAQINIKQLEYNFSLMIILLNLLSLLTSTCLELKDNTGYVFIGIIVVLNIIIIWNKNQKKYDFRLNIINELIQEYEDQIKKEEKYKDELVEFEKKYLSDLITTLQTTQKNMNDDIQEKIDSLKKDLKELNNT